MTHALSRPERRQSQRPFPYYTLTVGTPRTMSDQAQITVRRTTSYADHLRAYKIVVDGALVGTVQAGQSVTLPITPGKHSLRLRIDWCASEEIPFEAQPEEPIIFECGSSLANWRVFMMFFYVLFRPRKYLWLRRAA